MKKTIIIFLGFITLSSCTPESSSNENVVNQNNSPLFKEINVVNNDTVCSIIRNDTLVYSYILRGNKPYGIFRSYLKGKLFCQGLMVDSLKTSVWKYYNPSTSDLDSVAHYFNDKKVFTLDKNDFNLKSMLMNFSKVKVLVPSDWIVKENYEGTLFAIIKNKKDDGYKPNITLMYDINKDFDNYCRTAINMTLGQFSNSKIIETKDLRINDSEAREYVFTGNVNGKLLGSIVLIIKHNEGYYIYTASAGNTLEGGFLKYKGLFEEILYSTTLPDKKV